MEYDCNFECDDYAYVSDYQEEAKKNKQEDECPYCSYRCMYCLGLSWRMFV